jgi:hypothetical protein
MFEQFSGGYYLGELYVEPHDREHAVIQQADHEAMNEQLYAEGEGIERLDAPLVMKVDNAHFPVQGDDGVPSGTLVVPADLLGDDVATHREVLLAKANRAMELLRYAGWQPTPGT